MKIRSSLTRNTFALTMTPVALCLEELMPSNHTKTRIYSILIRTALVISTLIVGLSVPFFGKSLVIFSPASFCKIYATVQFCSNHRIYIYIFSLMNLFFVAGLVMALIGSLLTMLVVCLLIQLLLCLAFFSSRFLLIENISYPRHS